MGRKAFTKEDMTEWLLLDGRGITIVGDYTNTNTKTRFQCKNHHLWESTPANIKSGYNCPHCSKRNQLTKEDMVEWLLLDGRGITIVGDYTASSIKTTFQCSSGHQWESTPTNIKSGRGCAQCHLDSKTLSIKDWLSKNRPGVFLVGEYMGTNKKTTFECAHGHQWDANPNHIKSGGTGCPVCSTSGFNPQIPAWSYLLDFGHFIKFGITNNLIRRLAQHKINGDYKLIYSQHHEIGQIALECERYIKQTYGGRYATKDQCPDGYTETLPVHLLESVIESHKLFNRGDPSNGPSCVLLPLALP